DREGRRDQGDRLVLPTQEGSRTLLDCPRNLPQSVRVCLLLEDVSRQDCHKTKTHKNRNQNDETQIELGHNILSCALNAATNSSSYLNFDKSSDAVLLHA